MKDLGVLKLLLDLGDDAFSQLFLLTDLHLALISNPRIQNGLGFCGKGGGLFELVRLSLELRGFLLVVSNVSNWCVIPSYLRHLEEGLGNLHNTAELLDTLNSRLDSFGVVGSGSVQNTLDLVDLAVGPLLVHRASIFENSSPNAQETECDNGFLVDDVVFIAKGVDCGTGRG